MLFSLIGFYSKANRQQSTGFELSWRKVNLQGDTGVIKGAGLELGAQQATCPEPDLVGRRQMLGDPNPHTHPFCLRGGPARESGPPELWAGDLFSFSALTADPLLRGQQQPGQGSGERLETWRSGALWNPHWSNPPCALQPARLLQRAKEAPHSPHPARASRRLPMAASRKASDHLNPGCINPPNPFNSQHFL